MGLLGQLDSTHDGGCGRLRRCEASMSLAFSSLMSASKKKKRDASNVWDIEPMYS